jgi:hypothetical protein
MTGSTLDRRRFFLGTLSVSGAFLLPGGLGALSLAASPAAAAVPSGAGHVDDMWGHWPPYAHPIPYATFKALPHPRESLAPVDRMWGSGL